MLYDGSPLHPGPQILFDYADTRAHHGLRHVREVPRGPRQERLRAARQPHAWRALRTMLSTGSPLAPESFDYVYESIKPDVQLSSISGGTDIVSCFALGIPLLPV